MQFMWAIPVGFTLQMRRYSLSPVSMFGRIDPSPFPFSLTLQDGILPCYQQHRDVTWDEPLMRRDILRLRTTETLVRAVRYWY